jgi:AmmeMemoRadiSam system protein B
MGNHSMRPAAVAGMFYPGSARALGAEVGGMLEHANIAAEVAKALIVPHAGYVYSGPIAASAYVALRKSAAVIRRVVIFGPAHRVWVPGVAASSADLFETPLGRVPVDRAAIDAVADLPQVEVNDAAHAGEHSLEVQLPFLQAVLDDFSIAPFVVGGATAAQVAEVMDRLWGGPETLIVVSSDLSHYLPYADAQRIDRATVDSILHRHALGHHEQACGATPINGLLEVARRRNLNPALLDLRNSGDTAGDKSRVVGYAAFTFSEPDHA